MDFTAFAELTIEDLMEISIPSTPSSPSVSSPSVSFSGSRVWNLELLKKFSRLILPQNENELQELVRGFLTPSQYEGKCGLCETVLSWLVVKLASWSTKGGGDVNQKKFAEAKRDFQDAMKTFLMQHQNPAFQGVNDFFEKFKNYFVTHCKKNS